MFTTLNEWPVMKQIPEFDQFQNFMNLEYIESIFSFESLSTVHNELKYMELKVFHCYMLSPKEQRF